MKLNVEFIKLEQTYVDEAIKLVISSYQDEKFFVPFLPDAEFLLNDIRKKVAHLFQNGLGILATYNPKLVGFIAGYKIDEGFFGENKGIYVPLFGHGVNKKNKHWLYKELYTYAAENWVKQSYTSHAITSFAHDEDTINSWFWLGFGLRCVDGMRKVKTMPYSCSEIDIKKSGKDDIPTIAPLHREHNLYYRTSPIFMPNLEEDPINDLAEWLKEENHHLWIAYKKNKPVGYMRIQPNAESFISAHPEVMNITGAFVAPKERKLGIAYKLLAEIQTWLEEKEYSLCGVDFESINIKGSTFWNKNFTPYTYSMVRRVDERIMK